MVSLTLVLPPNGQQLFSPGMYGNLGVMYIAAVAEALGAEVKVADMRVLKDVDVSTIPETDFVGVTATSGEAGYAKAIAKALRKRNPETCLIVGGAHASLAPQDFKEDFDVVVQGEGELVLGSILNHGKRGLIKADRITDLDGLPFPARHLFNCFSDRLFQGEKYNKDEWATTILFSRGCPFRCAYCANIYHSVIYRSPENIAAEFEQIRDNYGVSAFRVEDDNLGVNMPWLRRVLEAIPKGTRLKGHMRADLVSHDLTVQLRNAGFEEIGLGVEACDNKVLKLINKGITEEDCYNAVKVLKECGLRVRVYFMSGLPGETEETIQKSIAFMRRVKPDKWTLSVTTPYPGSKLAEEPEKFGACIINREPSCYWNFAASSLELDTATNEQIMERHDRFKRFLESEEWKA